MLYPMRSHVACRLFITWGAPLVGVALVLLWWLSGSHVFNLNGPWGASASITGGKLNVVLDADAASRPEATRTGVHTYYSDYEWWFEGGWEPRFKWIAVPLWFPLLVLVAAAERAWRADRRAQRLARTGSCLKCGYDRSGLAPDAACPECGGGSQ